MKYITVDIPDRIECGFTWWVPLEAPEVINYIENENPGYSFLQFVTRAGNGGYPSYVILKKND